MASAGYNPGNNTVSVGGKNIPVATGDASSDSSASGTQAQDIKAKAIAYNPMADPKYDARSSIGASAYASGNAIALNPAAGMGQSLIGHELSHVVQQGSAK